MPSNTIASGAVVVTGNADQMVAALDNASAKVDKFGARTQASLQTLMKGGLERWVQDTEAKQSQWSSLSSKAWAGWEEQNKRKPVDSGALAQSKALIDSLDKSARAANESTKGLGANGLSDTAKGLKFGEVATLGLHGAIAALGLGIAKVFTAHYVDEFTAALERSKQIASELDEAIAKRHGSQQWDASRVTLESWEAMRKQVESSERSVLGLERKLTKFRDLQREMLLDPDRRLAKGLLGWLPPIGAHFEGQETRLKENLDETYKRLREERKQLEAVKALMLESVLKEAADPLARGIDDFLTRGKAFLALVVGNHKAIAAATTASLKELERTHATLGMSPADLAVYDAKAGGETDPQKLAELRKRAEGNERKKNELAIEDELKALQREAAVYGMTERAAQRLDMVQKGASKGQLARFDLLTKHLEQLKAVMDDTSNAAPKLAGAVLAGTQEALKFELSAKGFDVGDGNAIAKDSNEKLEKIRKLNEELPAEIAKEMAKFFGAF